MQYIPDKGTTQIYRMGGKMSLKIWLLHKFKITEVI